MNIKKAKEFFNARGWRLWLPGKDGGFISLLFLLFVSLPLLDRIFQSGRAV